jgi:hypothetical protein
MLHGLHRRSRICKQEGLSPDANRIPDRPACPPTQLLKPRYNTAFTMHSSSTVRLSVLTIAVPECQGHHNLNFVILETVG